MRTPAGSGEIVARPFGSRHQLALALIMLLAAVLRALRLDASLWYDEVVTLVEYIRLPFPALVATYESLNNHMFYSILAKASVALLGESAWTVRLPAVLFGLASIPVHWQIARRYVGEGEALVLALLLAMSYHHIWFSQNARGYTMLLFFTSYSVLCFLAGLERGSRRAWIGFALAAAGAIYTHLSALFFYAALALVYAVLLGRGLLRGETGKGTRMQFLAPLAAGAGALLLAVLLNLPVIASMASTIGRVSEATQASGQALAEWESPLRAVAEIGRSIAALGPLVAPALLGAVLTMAIGAVSLVRRAPVLLAIYLMQIPVTIAILLAFGMRIWPRYFFNEIGIFYLLAVHGTFLIVGWTSGFLERQTSWRAARPMLVGAAVAAMVVVSLGLLPRNYQLAKQPFTAARDYVEARQAPGERVATVGLAGYVYDMHYRPGWRSAHDFVALRALEAAPGHSWILVAFPNQTGAARAPIMREVARRYTLVRTFHGTLGDGAINIYRSRQ
jgi:uncharacterized membrane protein